MKQNETKWNLVLDRQNKQNFLSTGLSTDFSEGSEHACTSFVLTSEVKVIFSMNLTGRH